MSLFLERPKTPEISETIIQELIESLGVRTNDNKYIDKPLRKEDELLLTDVFGVDYKTNIQSQPKTSESLELEGLPGDWLTR